MAGRSEGLREFCFLLLDLLSQFLYGTVPGPFECKLDRSGANELQPRNFGKDVGGLDPVYDG